MTVKFPQINERNSFFDEEFPWENIFRCTCCGSNHLRIIDEATKLQHLKNVAENQESENRFNLKFYCFKCTNESELLIYENHCNVAMSYKPSKAFLEKLNRKKKRKALKTSVRFFVLKRDNYSCRACGITVFDGAKLEIDHIIPVSKGGTNEPDNLQVLCKTCNIGKSNKY